MEDKIDQLKTMYFTYGEYVNLEIDLDEMTVRVMKTNE